MLRPQTLLALSLPFLSTPAALAQPGRRGENAARYGWLSDYRAGREQAKKTGKPLMVVIRCFP